MSSENLFEDDFSEEIITELEQEYVTEAFTDREGQNKTDGNCVEPVEENADVNKHNSLTGTYPLINSRNNYNKYMFSVDLKLDNQTSAANSKGKLFQLPLTRIRNIMKLDPELHIASNEAVFLVTRATELFIESLAQESYSFTIEAKKKTVQKRDVDLAIEAVDSLMFLDGAMTF